jgi:hypothetical protein
MNRWVRFLVADFKVFNGMMSDKAFLDISVKERINDQHAIRLIGL